MVKVNLTHRLYFIVSQHSFDLYYVPENKTKGNIIGYYHSLDHLIRKATQFTLNKMVGEADFTGFLSKWNEIQQELGEYTSKYKF